MRDEWHMRGDAQMWLRSDVFDETSDYSVEAVSAMRDATNLMGDSTTEQVAADLIRQQLRLVLADTDTFWLRWRAWRRSKGWPA